MIPIVPFRASFPRLLMPLAGGMLLVLMSPAPGFSRPDSPKKPAVVRAVATPASPSPSPSPAAPSEPTPTPLPTATPVPPAATVPGQMTGDPTPAPSASPAPTPAVGPVAPIMPPSFSDARRPNRVRRVELRVDQPAPIPVALSIEEGEGTLVSFPAPITALQGFGVVRRAPAAGERADFFVIWGTGEGSGGDNASGQGEDAGDGSASHFLVTALRKGARKTLSVSIQGQPRPYTLVLVQADDDVAALSVHFDFPPSPTAVTGAGVPAADGVGSSASGTPASGPFPAGWDGQRVPLSQSRIEGLMTKLKGFPSLSRLSPDIYQNIEAVDIPASQLPDEWPGGLRARIVRVLRDHRLDALGFEVRLENAGSREFVYNPDALAVRVEAAVASASGAIASARPADEIYRSRWSEAAGRVAPGGIATAYFIVAGTEEGETNDLSPRNRFRLVLEAPTAPQGDLFPASPRVTPPRRSGLQPDRSKG